MAITNPALAHELMTNPRFQFGTLKVAQELTDSLLNELKLTPPRHTLAVGFLHSIKLLLAQLGMDPASITTTLGPFRWDYTMNLINKIFEEVVKYSPTHNLKWDEMKGAMETSTVANQPDLFCNALVFLLNALNAIKIDRANALMTEKAPLIIAGGIEYEQAHFQMEVPTTPVTEAWLRASTGSITDAILGLVFDPNSPIPEVFRFDKNRLATFRADFADEVRQTSFESARERWTQRVSGGSAAEPTGEVEDSVELLKTVMDLNMRVHGERYEAIKRAISGGL